MIIKIKNAFIVFFLFFLVHLRKNTPQDQKQTSSVRKSAKPGIPGSARQGCRHGNGQATYARATAVC